MPPYLETSLLLPGDGAANEDAIGWQANDQKAVCWVMDGATGLGEQQYVHGAISDAAWYVAWWQRFLAHNALAAMNWAPLLADGVQDIIAMWSQRTGFRDLPRYALPSASGVWVRSEMLEAGWQLSVMHTGDCRGYWLGDDNSFIPLAFHQDRAVDHDSPAARALYQHRQNMSLAEFRKAMMPYMRDSRAKMNQPDGYRILSLDPQAPHHFPMQTWMLKGSGHLILSTDGLFRLTDTFNVMDAQTLCHRLVKGELLQLSDELRQIEKKDAECITTPRYKTSDDVGVALWRFTTSA